MMRLRLALVALAVLFPSLAFAGTFDRNLSFGTTGTDVSQLQQFLTYEGLYNGPITPTFGPLTKKSLIAFQVRENIAPAVGFFGPLTRAKAKAILAAHPEWTTNLSKDTYYKNVDGNQVHSPAYSSDGVPAGASARCRDGTYSFSLNRRGTCSHHGGVGAWLY